MHRLHILFEDEDEVATYVFSSRGVMSWNNVSAKRIAVIVVESATGPPRHNPFRRLLNTLRGSNGAPVMMRVGFHLGRARDILRMLFGKGNWGWGYGVPEERREAPGSKDQGADAGSRGPAVA